MIYKINDIFERDETHPSCHASVIQELPNGELMCIWYAGKAEAHKSVAIKASWKKIQDDKYQWSSPIVIHKTPSKPDGNAIMFYYQNKLHLLHNVVTSRIFPWPSVILLKKESEDFGRTWNKSKIILDKDQKGYTVRNKALIIKDTIIIPTGQEKLFSSTSQMLISKDGETFHLSDKIKLPKGKCHQPTILKMDNNDILCYLRTNTDKIYKTISKDNGKSWEIPSETEFFNPNSALDMARTPAGEIVLVWNNNAKQGGIMKSRKAIHCAYSPDEGKTWPIIKELERDDEDGRFAYPSIIFGTDNNFHLTYTNRRKTIRYIKFDVKWIKSQ